MPAYGKHFIAKRNSALRRSAATPAAEGVTTQIFIIGCLILNTAFCLGIIAAANDQLPALGDFGVKPETLTALKEKIDAYDGTVGKPRSRVAAPFRVRMPTKACGYRFVGTPAQAEACGYEKNPKSIPASLSRFHHGTQRRAERQIVRRGPLRQRKPHGRLAADDMRRAVEEQMIRHRPAPPTPQPLDARVTTNQTDTCRAVAVDHFVAVDGNRLPHRPDDSLADERRAGTEFVNIVTRSVHILVKVDEE